MAPKKAAGKDKAPAGDVATLYVKREPEPPSEPPNVADIEDAWKVARDAFLCPLPEWDAERVDTTEWNPNEAELYTNDSFSVKLLPRPFMQHVSAWKRAHCISDNTAAEESAPEAKAPEPPPEKEPELDPKAKGKAKAAPAAAKGGKDAGGAKPNTMAQFAEVQYSGETIVVGREEFKTRYFDLSNDDSMPPLSQAIAAQISIVGEHGRILPHGTFLWELIFPQSEDGMPLFNPNGKYIVKLCVMGKWREVLVDDVVPVGSATGSASLHASILPASAPNQIWPMILSKALIRAYQHDLRAPILPAVQALTGLSLCQMPMSWQGIRSVYESRPFCVLQMSSKVDIEARQREALMMASAEAEKKQKDPRSKGAAMIVPALPALTLGGGGGSFGPQAPKLGAAPVDALLQFLICEVEDDPQQVRMKAATWRPLGGTPRKAVNDVAESEAGDEEEDLPRADQEDRQSDAEEHDEDEDEDRRSQRSPSGENTVPSARSKEEPGGDDAGGDSADVPEAETPGQVWPQSYPSSLMPKSESLDYHDVLDGGYWVSYDVLEDVCDSLIVYLPPGTSSASAQLDTTWKQEARAEPYIPKPVSLLKILLTTADLDLDIEPTPRGEDDDMLTPRERGPPCHKASFLYEPLRLDPTSTPSVPVVGPGSVSSSCMLVLVNQWNPAAGVSGAPEHVNMCVTETGGSSASRSVLLPSGEHWYLVLDDALKAGSVLSAHVDGAMLSRSKSSMEFVDPCQFLPELGVVMAQVGTSEYPAQSGFSVWAKAEVIINSPEPRDVIQLFSYVSDPALRSCLRLSLLRLELESCEDPAESCAGWSVTVITRVPLQAVMSLPLIPPEPKDNAPRVTETTVKYIIMLEANVPTMAKAGTFSLHVMLPPLPPVTGKRAKTPDASDAAPDGEKPAGPLQLLDLKVDQIMRWSGEVVQNEKNIILRERIVVPHGNGDVTVTIRVSVTGLPKVHLNAQLMAQFQPNQDMRPKTDGATPEPFQPGAPIDPREYNGRQNWLGSKQIVAKESGGERVMFLHVLLTEGSTYLLDVLLDPYKGPDKLEGGQWLLEMFGSSSEVEIGADTMEQDLEGLVRKSWEDAESDLPPRNERASLSRKRWLSKRGLLPEGEEAPPDEEQAAAAPKAEAKAQPKAKGKAGKDAPPDEPEVDKEQQEAEWLAAALERAGIEQHSNVIVDEFVLVHSVIEPTLVEEDPYTIAPVLDDDLLDQENEDSVAIKGLGVRGSAEVQQNELELCINKWEKIQEEVTSAVERNRQALIDLTAWSEETVGAEPKFKELREEMRTGLGSRYSAQQALKVLVGDAEKLDAAELQTALEEAEQQEVSVWDAELLETGGQKKNFIEDFNALRDRLLKLDPPADAKGVKAAGEPLVDEERETFPKLIASVSQLQKQLQRKKLPLPPEMFETELLQQASDAIAAFIALAKQGAGEEVVEGA